MRSFHVRRALEQRLHMLCDDCMPNVFPCARVRSGRAVNRFITGLGPERRPVRDRRACVLLVPDVKHAPSSHVAYVFGKRLIFSRSLSNGRRTRDATNQAKMHARDTIINSMECCAEIGIVCAMLFRRAVEIYRVVDVIEYTVELGFIEVDRYC